VALHTIDTLKKSLLPYLSFRDQLGPCECSPFVHEGQLYTVTSYLRLQAGTVDRFRIDGMLDRSIVEVDVPDLGYPNAFTKDGVVYVFGTSKDHKRITRTESTDLVNWSAPQTVFTSTNGDNLYNVSICPDPTGYMMAVEVTNTTDFPGQNRFVNRFMHSTDFATWTPVPGLLDNGSFVNCPVIRFHDGKYYVLYMTLIPETEYPSGRHMTLIARSADLLTWEHGTGYPDGSTVPLAPDNAMVDGTNTSDIDMVEFEGKTYFVYARGDQFNWTWLEVSSAVFDGTEKQFLQSFFPVNP